MRILICLVLALSLPACSWAADTCTVVDGMAAYVGKRDGADLAMPSLNGSLMPVLSGCGDVVDIQFVPGSDSRAVVLDQKGTAWWVDLKAKTSGKWLFVDTAQGWERGLLGLAFHPKFAENGRFFLNHTDKKDGALISQVTAWRADAAAPFAGTPTKLHLVTEVSQPYSNHNAGGLGFGPDGMLYVGWGDGGKANDPHGHGQNPKTALGAMLRLDVDSATPYAIPPDNPYVGKDTGLPEIWAIGLRNPWRYTWDGTGRMIVADVGQNEWEEVTFLTKGANAGWNTREGAHCFRPATGCPTDGLLDPLWDYPHSEGQSITGGYVAGLPSALAGRYITGDFGSGRIWAIRLPEDVGQRAPDVAALGKFPVKISTFGRSQSGQIYLAGWTDGQVYRLDVD